MATNRDLTVYERYVWDPKLGDRRAVFTVEVPGWTFVYAYDDLARAVKVRDNLISGDRLDFDDPNLVVSMNFRRADHVDSMAFEVRRPTTAKGHWHLVRRAEPPAEVRAKGVKKIVSVPSDLVARAVDALRYVARNEAGMSQAPYLFTAEETEEWGDAEELTRILGGK